MNESKIEQKTSSSSINICLDTLEKGKQALVFVNTKRGAEKAAEDISKKTGRKSRELDELSETLRNVLSSPTKQCERLADCAKRGVAFHHAGLHSKQKELIEENFRKGKIGIIACTPTLAMGVDLPAFRVVIRDLKRYGARGMGYIPVLEYLQMAGRAGRPKFDNEGEAVIISSTEGEKEEVTGKYIFGEPEEVYSKLAVEPVLRTYVLSLIASRFVRTRAELLEFFSRTFWAHQYKDMEQLKVTIDKMLELLEGWEFITSSKKQGDFVAADQLAKDTRYAPTFLGKRVAELYLDPLTANEMVNALKKSSGTQTKESITYLQMICTTLEMRPLLSVTTKDVEAVEQKLAEWSGKLLANEPNFYDPEYDEFLKSIKTAMMLNDWTEEAEEQHLLETYNTRPGETRAKLQKAEWLLYSMSELSNILNLNELIKEINRLRFRLRHGVKEELIPLLRLKGIGRVRARKLYSAGIKDLGDVKKAKIEKLNDMLGIKLAESVKKQVGEKTGSAKLEEF